MNAACEHSYQMDEETCFRVLKEIIFGDTDYLKPTDICLWVF
jgi:hypothetical protein